MSDPPTPARPTSMRIDFDVAHIRAHLADLLLAWDVLEARVRARVTVPEGPFACLVTEEPEVVGSSRCVAVAPGARTWWGYRAGRDVPTRFVAGAPEPTRTLTVWVERVAADHARVATIYAGPPAPREILDPGLEPSARADSERFWAEHALVGEPPGTTWLANAFSLNMLDGRATLDVRRVPAEHARHLSEGAVSVVAHADTAALFGQLLGRDVPYARRTIALGSRDRVLVGQYVGPRLPEGATALPEGASVAWFWVEVA